MNYSKRISLAVVIFIFTAAFVSANGISQTSYDVNQTYYVSAEGDDANNGLSEQRAFKTLAKAVTLASTDGGKRIVIVGTLDSNSEVNNEYDDSVFNISDSGDIEITITGKDGANPGKLLGGNGKRVITITGNSRVRFENILITGGDTEDEGGGIFAIEGAVIVLAQNAVLSGNCSSEGGGIFVEDGALIMLQNAAIRDNSVTTDEGGGGVLYGSVFEMADNAEISGNSGGGIVLSSSIAYMKNNAVIKNNQCEYDGGGIMLDETTFIMSGESRISLNKAGRNGGGIHAMNSNITIYDNALINQNEAEKRGGGISLNNSSLIVRGNAVISGNTGSMDGGGIYAGKSYVVLDENAVLENNTSECGGGLCIENFSSAIVRGEVKVSGNKSFGPQGGGGLCGGLYSNIHMTGGLVTNNSSSHGGGVYVEGAVFTFSGGSIIGNSARAGGGIFSGLGAALYIEDDSFVDENTPDDIFEY